jgi:NitT/TauT family transport system permease protein
VVNPFLVALYAIPKILVLPWILLIFGLGLTPAVVYGVLQGFFPICLLVAGGVRDVDRMPILVARSMGATTGQIYWKVILPAVRPAVRAGMRLGIVFCLLGVLVVEMFGGIRGMGFLLTTLANGFQAPELFAATALVSLLSVGIVLALK